VTITKAITINGNGTLAGILAAGLNGVVINAGVNDVVTLRNLDINGVGTGFDGIRFIAGKTLQVERCNIDRFTGQGIDCVNSALNSHLIVTNSTISNCNGGGILVAPTGNAFSFVTLENVRLEKNSFGLQASVGARVTVKDSVVASNTAEGFLALCSAANAATIAIESTVVSNNADGIHANGATTFISIGKVVASGNTGLALKKTNGFIFSFGNNSLSFNAGDGTPSSLTPLQ
jgi:hypothetical protein